MMVIIVIEPEDVNFALGQRKNGGVARTIGMSN